MSKTKQTVEFSIEPFPIALGGPDITYSFEVTPDLIDFDRDVHPDNNPSKAINVLDISVTCDTDPKWEAKGEVFTSYDFRRDELTCMSLGFNPALRSRYSIWPTFGLELDKLPKAKAIICEAVKNMYERTA